MLRLDRCSCLISPRIRVISSARILERVFLAHALPAFASSSAKSDATLEVYIASDGAAQKGCKGMSGGWVFQGQKSPPSLWTSCGGCHWPWRGFEAGLRCCLCYLLINRPHHSAPRITRSGCVSARIVDRVRHEVLTYTNVSRLVGKGERPSFEPLESAARKW